MCENCEEDMRLGRRKESCAEREIMWGRRQDKTGHERTGEKRGK